MVAPFPVDAAEVAELAQESRRLTMRDEPPTSPARRAYLERKVEMLQRITFYGAVLIDEHTARGALAFARGQLDHCNRFASDGVSHA